MHLAEYETYQYPGKARDTMVLIPRGDDRARLFQDLGWEMLFPHQ
jgi:hypothetical protein